MIELERHIEILLLSNDCVIVPHLGGFMTHHVEARYDEEDSMFLPPMRTLGFNPQLNINDSLLVQSYIEAYDISYPEALQRIDEEVNELKQHLENKGSYELNDIGVLSLNDDGNLVFTPCEAGILTPVFYGLSSFDIEPLKTKKPVLVRNPKVIEGPDIQPAAQIISIDSETNHKTEVEIEESNDGVIRIKYSWIRNAVAVAAILLAIFILAIPTGKTEMMTRTISNINNGILFGMMSEDTNTSKIEIKKADIEKTITKTDTLLQCDTIASIVEPEPVLAAEEVRKDFCIVLASYVSMRNANAFVEQLKQRGYDQAEIFVRNNVTRVIFGHYVSEQEAYNDLRKIHRHKDLAEAWILKL